MRPAESEDLHDACTSCDHAPCSRLPHRCRAKAFGTPPAPHALRLVYVGRLIPEKGLFEALDAIAMLAAAGRRLDFTVAGTGESAGPLALQVRALGLDAIVHFTGPVAGEPKTRLWQRSEVLLLPSYSEGLPYALLEAMASGTPAITCAVGAIPDVLQDGVHGLLVPPRDALALAKAIARLDDDRSLLERLGAAARCRVRDAYSVDHLTASFATLYGEMLDASA